MAVLDVSWSIFERDSELFDTLTPIKLQPNHKFFSFQGISSISGTLLMEMR